MELNLISLGAGVQSSVMALMAKHGELGPMPDGAIFSDTGAEPDDVYDWLDWLEDQLPFPVYRVMHKEGLTKALEDATRGATHIANPPFYTEKDGESGILRRKCTTDFKITPINKKVRELLGLKPKQRTSGEMAIQWIGISLDEIQRMRESREKYTTHIFPLVEKRMRRGDCKEWMKRNDYPEPPRSACVYCPYHSNHEWRRLKEHDQNGWDEAVRIDKLVRSGVAGTNSTLYIHKSGKPLEEVDLSTDVDRGQLTFLDECEGMCGV
jgi:hypothetical protein